MGARITSDDVAAMVSRDLARSGARNPPDILSGVSRELGYTEAWAAELATALAGIRDDQMTKDQMRAVAARALSGMA
jgi:hypothetical protein